MKKSYGADKFRKNLLDKDKFIQLARFFIKKSVQLQAAETEDPKFCEYLRAGLDFLVDDGIDLIFRLTESPIERIFINSLVLGFIKADPLNLVIQHSVKNAPKQIREFRERRLKTKEFASWYVNKYGNLTGIEDFLDKEVLRGKMEKYENKYLKRHIVLYEYLCLEDRFHLILQPGYPNIKVENRTVRPDMLFWVPSDPSVKIVVECDGFEYHSDKVVFIHDRKRDRSLKAAGYEVLRYSGSEIHKDPIGASNDLGKYLWSREVGSNS
jgi:hypothetical protein